MTRYLPSRSYLYLGLAASGLSAFSAFLAAQWAPAAVPAGLFFATAVLNFFLWCRPIIELTSRTVTIGDKEFLWSEIEGIERTGWISPLVVKLLFRDGSRALLIYPGAMEGSKRLSDDLARRLAKSREYSPARALAGSGAPSMIDLPLFPPDEEAEIERLYQRLKSVGHLEPGDDR